MTEKGHHLDLSSESSLANTSCSHQREDGAKGFLGVHFACCDVYSRVYPNKDRTAYLGNCPRCARQVRFTIGSGGTDSRFFTAY